MATAAIVVVATIVWSRHGSSAGPTEAPPPVAVLAVPAANAAEPATRVRGVPVGWSHGEVGASAAAAAYVRAAELVATVGPLERRDIIATFTTESFGPTLAGRTNGQLDDLLFALGARGRSPADLTWREFPLTAQSDTRGADEAVVEVWSVSLVAVAGGSVARQTWHTETLILVWRDGDWKVDGWSSQPGPTPGLASDADLSPVPAVEANAGWPTVSGRS